MITPQYQGNGALQGIDINSIIASIMQGAAQNSPGQAIGTASLTPQASQPGWPAGGGVSPQGFDIGDVLNTVAQSAAQALPGLLMSLLSAHPQIQQIARQGGTGGGAVNPQSAGLFGSTQQYGAQPGATVSPQGFDFAQIINTVAQNAAVALPGLLMNLLSAHPQIQQLARQGGAVGGVSPQSLLNIGVRTPIGGVGLGLFGNTPQLGAGVTPQGIDLGSILSTVAQSAAQALPGLLMSLLSAHPQIQQAARQSGAIGGGVNPQSLFDIGVKTPVGSIGMGLFGNTPQFGAQTGAAVSPQGFDFGQILTTVAQNAGGILPNLLMNLLSAHPQIQQLARQGGATGGVTPQSLLNIGVNTPFASGSLGMFGNTPQFGAQPGAGVSPQGFDFTGILNAVAQEAAQQLPGLVMSLLSAHPQIKQLIAQGADLGQLSANRAAMH